MKSHVVHPLRAWAAAIRPNSLLMAVAPVLVGASLGYLRTGHADAVVAGLALAAAVLMQVITNLQNDVGYTERGGEDLGTRIGLPRATARGWLTLAQVHRAIVFWSVVAVGVGLALVAYRGWPVLAIGTVSLLGALAYMGGPKPIAYTPFGELTVFLFFGWIAVLGTDWLLTGGVSWTGVTAATSIGGLAAAALAVNNHRDMEHDRAAGRKTFAVVFGAQWSQALFGALLFVAFALVPLMALSAATPQLLLPLVLAPGALRIWRAFRHCAPGVAYNNVLFRVFRLVWMFAFTLSLGAASPHFRLF